MGKDKKKHFLQLSERNHKAIKKQLAETISYLVEVQSEFNSKPHCDMSAEDELAFANDVALALSRLKGIVGFVRERQDDREALQDGHDEDDDDEEEEDSDKWKKGDRPDHLK